MAKANLVEKAIKMDLNEIIKFQIATHCHLNNITISNSDLNCMSLLGLLGEVDLSEFCVIVSNKKIFKTTQTVRNCLARMEKSELIIKDGPSKKRFIKLNPKLNIQVIGNIVLLYKVISINDTD